MSNEIKVPEILIQQKYFCLKIDENNTKLFTYIEYLKKLVTNMHGIYSTLCKNMIQISQQYERKIINYKYTSNHSMVILNFIKNINFLHLTINNQLSNNTVFLGTKTNKIGKKRLEILRQKLLKCNQLNKQYLSKVEIFNKKEKSFRQKCQYFNDYQKDANTELYQKLSTKQLRLKQRVEDIIRSKDQYKINISQIKITIKEYYQLELNIVSQYKKLFLNIRKSNINKNQIYNQPIIEEESEDAHSTLLEEPPTRKSDKLKEKSVVQMRKEIIRDYEINLEIQQLFEQLMRLFQEQIIRAGRTIDQIREQKQYENFISQRLIISQILPSQSMRQIDLIINEIAFFRSIILKIINICGKLKVLTQLKRYRGFNFDRFVQDTNIYAQRERKNGYLIDIILQYKQIEQKFNSSHNEYNIRYQQRIIELQKLIYGHYYLQDQILQDKNKKYIKSDLFQKKYYQILIISFFINRNDNINFIENIYLKKFNNHINANKIQKMITLNNFYNKQKKIIFKSTCCGLIKKLQEEQNKSIDQYLCALKDGMILIQGQLKLYQNYINFTSNFNSKTLFGYSDIRIPKWDINNFTKDRHLLSVMIVVQTNHGVVCFTNFITNPYETLLKIYNNRKSGVSIAHKNTGQTELQSLQQRFQSELRPELKKRNIIIDKLSTYLSEDMQSLSICIEYHINGLQETSLFQIKMNYSEITLQYMFIHGQNSKNNQNRAILQAVSKDLINKKTEYQINGKTSKFLNNISLDFQYSIIQQNQKNKISFLKQPSFINRKSQSPNQDNLRVSQLQFGQLLTSRNFLSNQETSKNIEALQQKIFQSDENQSIKEQQNSDEKISAFNLQGSRISINSFNQKERNETIDSKKADKRYQKSGVSKQSVTGRLSSKSTSNRQNYQVICIFIGILLGMNLILGYFI